MSLLNSASLSASLPVTHLPGAHARRFRRGETTVVELHGEIDLCTAAALSAELDTATEPYAPHVLIDLRPVTFIDSSGLDLLHRAHCRARSRDGWVRLVVDKPRVRQLVRLAAPGLLPLCATPDDTPATGRAGRG
ncbi:anti-sigma B factor antagonist [Streptomyces sp. V3I8]|uniref:STAS domain-containing protein n=1 Tax=Streptomyces sp. V3I8 TaxID=3042279 RepID=UPI0027858485|nr:STAS domain-containing protein [Streptomyces sp. V3I8]MDQ1033825.1 anti-sigma B factor antagonist [Streptomyces sp. V3I8]